MAEREIHIKEFDLSKIRKNSKVVVIGKPGTGKTTIITSILQAMASVAPVGIIMSGTEDSSGTYSKFFPGTFIYNKLDIEKMEDFVKRQKMAQHHDLPEKHAILLLDDCTDEPKELTHPIFHKIFKNGRHYDMMFILSLQYALDVKPFVRANTDYTILLAQSNPQVKRALYENYVGTAGDYQDFSDLFDELTKDFTAMVIDNNGGPDLESSIFYYRANIEEHESFRFGCNELWDWHDERHDNEKSAMF